MKKKAASPGVNFHLILVDFCSREGENLFYKLPSPLQHNNLPYDELVFIPENECPMLRNSSDGWMAPLDCFSNDDCRDVLMQVCRQRMAVLTKRKKDIVKQMGIGAYADELRDLQDKLEYSDIIYI